MSTVWKSKDGREFLISEMDDQHLRNSINMIRRGYDREGSRVSPETRAKLPELICEFQRRKDLVTLRNIEAAKVAKKDNKKYNHVDVRFAENPCSLRTYRIRKGAKPYLGQSLVVSGAAGSKIAFVVGINSGRTGIDEITEKVVKL